MRETVLFAGKIYTAGTNFTRLLVVTVATNLNSGQHGLSKVIPSGIAPIRPLHILTIFYILSVWRTEVPRLQ